MFTFYIQWISPEEKNTVSQGILDKLKQSSSFFRVMEDVIEKFQYTDTEFACILKDALSEARGMIKVSVIN
jgi:hypothetical protein